MKALLLIAPTGPGCPPRVRCISSMAASSITWAFLLSMAIMLVRYMQLSPLLTVMLAASFVFILTSHRPAAGAEQFSPVYVSSTTAGLRHGVAAVQGRRQYMEDMHQAIGFDAPEQRAAARVGLTHFFAVFDGHGGKRAAQWAHTHLVSNLLRELGSLGATEGDPAAGEIAPGDACAAALDGATVDAFHRTDGELRRAQPAGCHWRRGVCYGGRKSEPAALPPHPRRLLATCSCARHPRRLDSGDARASRPSSSPHHYPHPRAHPHPVLAMCSHPSSPIACSPARSTTPAPQVTCLIQDGSPTPASGTASGQDRPTGAGKRRLLVANLGDSRCVMVGPTRT